MKARRFLGIELGGSRRTAAVALDFFAGENKTFLAELESPLRPLGDETADETLIRVVKGMGAESVGVDAPLTLPPCLRHKKSCGGIRKCKDEATAWMREEAKRLKWGRGKLPIPYLQRPVDMLLRGRWQDDAIVTFPVDESFGASRAPLAARMQYLQRELHRENFLEVIPRLALGGVAHWYGLSAREVRRSRDVEEGVEQRMGILDTMSQPPRVAGLPQLFLYESDVTALAQDLSAFDAFLCAFLALAEGLGLTEEPDFSAAWGNVVKPRRMGAAR